MLKKYLLNTVILFLLLTPYHAYAQFGDFLKKAAKEVENAVEEVAEGVSDELRIEKNEASSETECIKYIKYAEANIKWRDRRSAVLKEPSCAAAVATLQKNNRDILWETNWEKFSDAVVDASISISDTEGSGSQIDRTFQSDKWLATLHMSRINPRIDLGDLNFGCEIDLSSVYATVHPERYDPSRYEGSIFIKDCDRRTTSRYFSFDEIQKWFDDSVSRNAVIFETSVEYERKINNWTNDQTAHEYRRRLSTVLEMVDEQYDGKLKMWRDRGDSADWFFWIYNETVLRRLTWMCENIFDDIAIEQAGKVSSSLGVTSEQLCGPLLDSFEETFDSLDPRVSELAKRLAATTSLDPEKIASSDFLITPSNFAYLNFVLGYYAYSNDLPDAWVGRTNDEWDLTEALAHSMAMLSANVMFTAWYGFEPPTPFTFYRDQIQDAAKEFLFGDVKNLADIDRRAQQTNLDDDDFTFLLSTIDERSLDQKSQRILSVYKEKFGDYAALADQQNQLASQKIEEQKRKDYLEAYILFATVEACFTARREYLVKYITREQFSAAKTKWTDLRSSFDLSDNVKSSVEAEIEERDSYRLFMTSVSLAQYTDAMAQDCSLALTALNLR